MSDSDDGRTEVLLAGGASLSLGNATEIEEVIAAEHRELEALLQPEFPVLEFRRLDNSVSTSHELSKYLLDTYNHRNRSLRFGAYALHDSIRVSATIKWDELEDSIRTARENIAIESIDLTKLLASGEEPVQFNVSVSQIADIVYAETNLTPDSSVSVSELLNLTERWLDAILIDGNDNLGSMISLDSFSSVVDVVDALRENATIDSSVVQNETQTLVTDVLQLYGFDNVANLSDWIDLLFDGSTESFDLVGIAAIFLAENVLRQVTESADVSGFISTQDVFVNMSESLGGSDTLDGFIHVQVPSATIFIPQGYIEVLNVSAVSQNGVLFEGGSFNLSVATIEALLYGTDTYAFHVDSPASVLHNSSSPHAVSAFNQAYHNFAFKKCTGSPQSRLVSVNEPLPLTNQQSVETQTILSILAAFFILIPVSARKLIFLVPCFQSCSVLTYVRFPHPKLCYVPGAFVTFLVNDRISKSKHIQLTSGVFVTSYWTANYLYDVTLFFILSFLVMMVLLFYLFGDASSVVFVGDVESFFCTMSLLLGYGLSILPFSYVVSRRFDNPSSAQIAVIGVVFITGFVAVNAYFIMDSLEKTQDIAQGLRPLFRTWPAYNLGEGLIALSRAYWEREILLKDNSPFDWDLAGKNVLLLFCLTLPYACLLLTLEFAQQGCGGGYIGRYLRSMRDFMDRTMLRCYGIRARDLDEQRLGEEDDDVPRRAPLC